MYAISTLFLFVAWKASRVPTVTSYFASTDLKLCTICKSPLHGPRNYVEIAYINYKNLRYTFDKSAEKIDGRVLVPSPMLSLVISSASLNIFV